MQSNDHILITNRIMEVIFWHSKSSMGISENQLEELKILWSKLSDKGIEVMTEWAKRNEMRLPYGLVN